MKRPWELADADRRAGAGGPRVYVPVSLPDSPSATFAVLELVGFSSSPSSTSSPPPHQADALLSPPLHSPSHPLFAGLYTLNSTNFALGNNPSRLLSTHIENLQQSSHTAPLAIGMDYTHATAITTSFTPPNGTKSSSPPSADGRAPIVKTTMKENVVHTTSSNFKDVVQKLTGACGKTEDKLPVTLPNRMASTASTTNASSKSLATSKVFDALSVRMDASKALKRSSSCKLLERRKGALFSKLEQIHNDEPVALEISTLTPLSPSPITPLTSYFEKVCSAITPTPSPSSNISSSPSRQSLQEAELSSKPILVNDCSSPSYIKDAKTITKQRCASLSLSQALCGPPLLNLFPESPISSPQHS
ncbi:hypothetical protein L7F22_045642 [Adiantum nelumboides]|nr:hypothetical protein [Adiantum nelumboides]